MEEKNEFSWDEWKEVAEENPEAAEVIMEMMIEAEEDTAD